MVIFLMNVPERTFLHKLARITGLYRLKIKNVNPLDEFLFSPDFTKFSQLKLANSLQESVHHFYSNS